MNFSDFIIKVLDDTKIPMTSVEIWNYGKEKGYDIDLNSKGKTPWLTIGSFIYEDIKKNKLSLFERIDTKPYKFILKKHITEDTKNSTTIDKTEISSLSDFIIYYLFKEFKIYTKRIRLENNNWELPDLVGVSYPYFDFNTEGLELSNFLKNDIIKKLFSFCIEYELNHVNMRELFFKAVSNSSWANEGYLIVSRIEDNEKLKSELLYLSEKYGIGIIYINEDDFNTSYIFAPATTNNTLDWNQINLMFENSDDFKEFTIKI